jgi:hypothetical protein
MKGIHFNSGQPVKKETLAHSQDSIEEAVRERNLDLFNPGILKRSQFGGEPVPFDVTSAGLFVSVGSGVAVAPSALASGSETVSAQETVHGGTGLKTGGERIVITVDAATNDVYDRVFAAPQTGIGTGPFKESINGLSGQFASTPRSSGAKNIPVTNDTTSYLWIGYLKTVDTSETAIHQITGEIFYPKTTDGYDIVVTPTDSSPEPGRYLKLAELVASGGSVTVKQSGETAGATRTFSSIRLERSRLKVTKANAPAVYTEGTDGFLDDHINCIGTAGLANSARITPRNPHGMSVNDLDDTDIIGTASRLAQKHSHVNGISAPLNETEAFKPEIANGVSIGGSSAIVRFIQLLSDEAIFVDGIGYQKGSPQDSGAGVTAGGNNAYVPFFASDEGAGVAESRVYQLFIKPDGTLDKVKDIQSLPTGAFKLATVLWANGTLSALVDLRKFDLLDTVNIRDRAVHSVNIGLADGSSGQDTTQGIGIKTGHLQDSAVDAAKIKNDAVTPDKVDETGSYVVGALTVTTTANINGLLSPNAGITIAGATVANGTLFVANQTEPATPAGGGVIYVDGGSLKFKGSSGTVTTIADA